MQYFLFGKIKEYEISVLTESRYVELFNCLPFIKKVHIDNRPKIFYLKSYFKILRWFISQT